MKPERNLKEKDGVQVGDVSAWTSGSDEADIPEPFDVVDVGGQEVRPPDRRVRFADRRDARHAGAAGEPQHATGRPDAVLRTEITVGK